MKVAHLVIVTPRRCGLYETTRELVDGLRRAGIDSRLVEPGKNKLYPQGYPEKKDRGIPVEKMEWAANADLIVNHSGYDGTIIEKTEQPVIHVAHGRPRHGFLTEKRGGASIYSYHYRKNQDPRWKAVVTFWPEHVQYLEVMFPDKPVKAVTAPVDLTAWKPGPKQYRFNGRAGDVNVVMTDAWREDVDPYLTLNAFALWARTRPGAKCHLYAKPDSLRGYTALIRRIQDEGHMGEMLGWIKQGLDEIYRSADVLLTANKIATRAVREAMACGCPVAVIDDTLDTSGIDQALVTDREIVRHKAQAMFNPKQTARELKAIIDRAVA